MTTGNSYSYFFRESESLEAVCDEVLRRHRESRPIALWCAGCAAGEEAYSLAICAAEIAVPVEILGTDADPRAVAAARRAAYSARSLRYASGRRQERWFARYHEGFLATAALREAVAFRTHDLLHEPAPAPARGAAAWDVVLCRNVFLYFDEAQIRATARLFLSVLRPGGHLVLGAAERLPGSAPIEAGGFELRLEQRRGCFLYEKRAAEPAEDESPVPTPREATPAPSDRVGVDPEIGRLRERGDHLQDQGSLDEAALAYREAIARDDLLADLHLRLGSCYLRMHRREAAHEALRRALFIAPDLWPAAFLLGEFFVDTDAELSRRYLLQARGLLEREPLAAPPSGPDVLAPFVSANRAALDAISRRLGG